MSHVPLQCDPAALDALLAEQLAEPQRLTVEAHLGDCPACRERLERLTAEPEVWAQTREFLSSIDDVPGRRGNSVLPESGLGPWRDEAELPRPDVIAAYLGPTDDPQMLGRFGGYEIAGIIGCGGMGIVLKGLDVPLNRYVAIKVLAPHLATSAAARLRFAREARAAAAVVHENVIAIHAVSEANGLPYLVMPYLRGESLQKRLDQVGRLSATEVLRIARQVALGLAAAHAQGLVHRDIKLANILLEDGIERLTITDFGLARAADDASLTRSGVIAGTPQFMSPEQARGEAIDQRSDLFSLGSVLYMLCTGHPPFRAETSYGVLRRISDDPPRPIREINPEIPEWLARIVARLHEKTPDLRFQSAEEVAALCEQCLAHVQQPMSSPLPEGLRTVVVAPASRNPLRKWILWGAALSIFALSAGGLVWNIVVPPRIDQVGVAGGNASGESHAESASADVLSNGEKSSNGNAPSGPAWNDDEGVDDALRELDEDASQLEREANQLWTE